MSSIKFSGTPVDATPAAPAQITFNSGSGSSVTLTGDVVVPAKFVVDMTKTTCRYMFSNCSFTSLQLPDGFGREGADFSYCFSSCSKLSSLRLPDGFGREGTDFYGLFNFCVNLKQLALPDGFGRKGVRGTGTAFQRCEMLEDITGPIEFPESFNLGASVNLTHDSLVNVLNGLVEVVNKTLTLGSANLAKLTADEKKIATDKGWTLV